jgi:hypothetical protein
MKLRFLSLSLLAFVALPMFADEKPDPTKSNLPVEVKLTLKQTKFKLDLTADELKKQLKEAAKTGRYPKPPVFEITLEVRNRSQKEVQVWHKGDPVQVTFELKGPGAVTAKPLLAFTSDFRVPEATKLEPGKSLTMPLKGLIGGFRNASEYTYWTEPGEYTLTAKLKTGLSPAPEGLKAEEGGFAPLTIPSDSVKITVEGK